MATILENPPQAPSSTAPCSPSEPSDVPALPLTPTTLPGLQLDITAALDRHDIELLCGVER